jgi:hypothetical protein
MTSRSAKLEGIQPAEGVLHNSLEPSPANTLPQVSIQDPLALCVSEATIKWNREAPEAGLPKSRSNRARGEESMDPVTVRVICGILAIALLSLIVLRRRQRSQQ